MAVAILALALLLKRTTILAPLLPKWEVFPQMAYPADDLIWAWNAGEEGATSTIAGRLMATSTIAGRVMATSTFTCNA